jgi:hypothetical protein
MREDPLFCQQDRRVGARVLFSGRCMLSQTLAQEPLSPQGGEDSAAADRQAQAFISKDMLTC